MRVYTHLKEHDMTRYYLITPPACAYTHMDENDEPFVFEATPDNNPMDMDDPETAYREYLAERFAR